MPHKPDQLWERTRNGIPQGNKPTLSYFLQGQISLLGFGNRMWGDDGVGSWLAQALEENTAVHAVDGGMVPENHLEKIVLHNPEAILLVDAGDFGGEAGEWRLLEPDDVLLAGVSTHAGSPQLLAKYLEARTGARVGMLVIQPGDVSEGEGLSPEVSATMNQLLELFTTDYSHTPFQ